MKQEQIDKLVSFAAYYANCPCCDESEQCSDGCTFEQDYPVAHDVLIMARAALKIALEKVNGVLL